MKPVDQTSFYDPDVIGNGNCTEAAVASILGLELSDVPRFYESGKSTVTFWDNFESFLNSKGFHVLDLAGNYVPDCFYLASGSSTRKCKHMVIMRRGELAHDPHPSRLGITQVDRIYVLVPFDLNTFVK